ncbi:hypothetical protein GCM10011490_23050 [Pseudoclavibacter endophyticus]|nr:hypothetical protein [Pseudoclavibacter endophyticus]GGA71714.1 hypothetical protein GCM10011490_23050 [Pseudoclavibacter endophyticus]
MGVSPFPVVDECLGCRVVLDRATMMIRCIGVKSGSKKIEILAVEPARVSVEAVSDLLPIDELLQRGGYVLLTHVISLPNGNRASELGKRRSAGRALPTRFIA